MKTKLYFFICLLILTTLACGLPSASAPEPTIESEPPTPNLPFVASPVQEDSTGGNESSDTTQFANTVRDEFDGKLAPGLGWTWLRQDQSGWSLTATPGWLRINLSTTGYLNGLPSNVLTTPAPQSDFDLRTSVNFSPTQNFEFAGLIILFDEKSVLQAGRAFCNVSPCPGSGYYFDNLQNGSAAGGNFGIAASGSQTLLRIVRQGNVYTAYYQTDAVNWVMIGSHTVGRQPTSVGLIAARAPASGRYAEFDYFEISQP